MATIVIDTETTGFVAGEDELLQVSVIEQDGSVLFNEYFRPTAHTEWTAAEAVNHISPEMVADCPCIADRLPELQAIFDKADTIIGTIRSLTWVSLQQQELFFPITFST